MKKLTILLLLVAIFWSCEDEPKRLTRKTDPDNDTILFQTDNIIASLGTNDYTLAAQIALNKAISSSDSALANSIASNSAFNTTYTGKEIIPDLLSTLYPDLSGNDTLFSTAMITYNESTNSLDYLSTYSEATKFILSDNDYESCNSDVGNAGYFYPSQLPETHLPNILANNFPNALTNDIIYTTYNYKNSDPVGGGEEILFTENFNQYNNHDTIKLDGWTNYTNMGNRLWEAREYNENKYAQISSYSSEEQNDAYLITPSISLSSGNNFLSFDVNVGYWTHAGLEVFISTNFNGSNFNTATWINVTSNFTIPTEPTSGYGTFVPAGEYNLSDFGGTINVAFRYSGDGNNGLTTTFQLDNITVKSITSKNIKEDPIEIQHAFYIFDGTNWDRDLESIILNPADYDAMGGPGTYDNFSASYPPENYIPAFLTSLMPLYIENGYTIVVSYQYYNNSTGSVVTMADEYIKDNDLWRINTSIESFETLFTHKGNGWVADPSVYHEMMSNDYQMIVDYVSESLSPNYLDTYGTGEYYFGSTAYYSNFDLRISRRIDYGIPGFEGLSEEESMSLIMERLKEALVIFLELKFPEAVAEIDQMVVYYYITFATYNNDHSRSDYQAILKCKTSYPNTEFEFISMNEL